VWHSEDDERGNPKVWQTTRFDSIRFRANPSAIQFDSDRGDLQGRFDSIRGVGRHGSRDADSSSIRELGFETIPKLTAITTIA